MTIGVYRRDSEEAAQAHDSYTKLSDENRCIFMMLAVDSYHNVHFLGGRCSPADLRCLAFSHSYAVAASKGDDSLVTYTARVSQPLTSL